MSVVARWGGGGEGFCDGSGQTPVARRIALGRWCAGLKSVGSDPRIGHGEISNHLRAVAVRPRYREISSSFFSGKIWSMAKKGGVR